MFQRSRMGIGYLAQEASVFRHLTVEENLLTGAYTRSNNKEVKDDLERVYNYFPRLRDRRTSLAGYTSGGEQQMLVIGRALMTNPNLLILDEATEGLSPTIRSEIWKVITILKNKGVSILIIDKSLKQLQDLADKFYILEKGKTVWNGFSNDLTSKIAQRYLGV